MVIFHFDVCLWTFMSRAAFGRERRVMGFGRMMLLRSIRMLVRVGSFWERGFIWDGWNAFFGNSNFASLAWSTHVVHFFSVVHLWCGGSFLAGDVALGPAYSLGILLSSFLGIFL